MEENKENNTQKEVNSHKVAKASAIGGFVLTFIILFIIKSNVDSFSVKWFVVIMVLAGIICLAVWFSSEIYKFFMSKNDKKSESGHPKAITKAEAREFFDIEFTYNPNYLEYTDTSRKVNETVETHGKNGDQLIYTKEFNGLETGTRFAFLLNMHYPNLNSILTNPTQHELSNAKKKTAVDPETPEDKTTIERINPLLGIHEKQKTVTYRKSNNKSNENKGDLK